jgi:metal iron transporter
MNKTSRTDEPYKGEGHNQSPNPLSNDLTTNQDLNGIVNAREQKGNGARSLDNSGQPIADESPPANNEDDGGIRRGGGSDQQSADGQSPGKEVLQVNDGERVADSNPIQIPASSGGREDSWHRLKHIIVTFGKFIGPGFLVSVAYSRWSLPPKFVEHCS